MKHLGLFAAGVLFGTAGLKILGSKDAKKVYSHTTAAVLRAKDCVMKAATTVREGAEDVYADAKDINEARLAAQKLPSWRTLRKRKRPQQNNCFPEGPLPRSFGAAEKAAAFPAKRMRLDYAHNLCTKGAQIPHLRGEKCFSGWQSHRIKRISVLFRPAGRNSARL